ncbi:nSTAND1 domain-containing NTPase [Actinomadura madurae]|uniref:nSTAND1 domain-containing NTPase n=1 Tax=Actinomadura madurae TaxID=1993 RepID=UPI003558BEB5
MSRRRWPPAPRRPTPTWTPARRRLARHVFHRLTAVSRDGRLARRTVQRPDLHAGHSDRERAGTDRILDVFAARRLIVVDDSGVQIAHDVLLHAWPRLRGWLEADLSDHALYNQLVDAAGEWAATAGPPPSCSAANGWPPSRAPGPAGRRTPTASPP